MGIEWRALVCTPAGPTTFAASTPNTLSSLFQPTADIIFRFESTLRRRQRAIQVMISTIH